MSCIGCNQAIIEANAQKEKTYNEAKQLARETGVTYAIYRDEQGVERIIRADESQLYPVIRYVSPYL